jgi:uncharacterized protein (DUF58 family)
MAGAKSTAKLGVALLLAAALFDAEPLYVGGAAFCLLAALCTAWVVSGASGLKIERRLGAAKVEEDRPLAVEVVLTGARVALPTCEIEDPLLDEPARLRGGRRTVTLPIEARFPRRGRQWIDPPRAVLRDPLRLAERVVSGRGRDEILVLPRVEPILAAADGDGAQGTVTRRPRPGIAPAAEVDIDGLRPHRDGAPASRIHWPAFARTGVLLERRLRPEGDTRPLVVLDPRGPDEDAIDMAVRAAASLCVHLARSGGCGLLLPGDRRPTPLEPGLAGWPHLHTRLALVDTGASPSLAGMAARRGAVIYVAARVTGGVPRALLHAPTAAARVLVVPGRVSGRVSSFAVAGCHGYELEATRRRRAAA